VPVPTSVVVNAFTGLARALLVAGDVERARAGFDPGDLLLD
jgi:hypothetical protein